MTDLFSEQSHWAILSGLEGNLTAYNAVLDDIRKQAIPVDAIYILGDVVGLHPQCSQLLEQLRSPQAGEPSPQICTGWWEEQCFNLHGVGPDPQAFALKERYGDEGVEALWNAVPREQVEWLRSLDFGFMELDALLIHGSTVGYDDELTPDTPASVLLDRLIRADANQLFCGRSGLAFEYCLKSGQIASRLTTLDGSQAPISQILKPRKVVGVGSVGRIPNQASYCLYCPTTNKVEFRQIS
ncbi:metallophosphoesterase family protein [Sodalinema gerasimenkoae]|uniref:metallophosphoesterase family protein n=1 Tax=Sodalinema gerasimenkoae TaxID=2862348 RepID=UPI001359F91B|nr:metallophosphoesterase family protein [Sodalinema gerasimenkoae]